MAAFQLLRECAGAPAIHLLFSFLDDFLYFFAQDQEEDGEI